MEWSNETTLEFLKLYEEHSINGTPKIQCIRIEML